MDPFSVSTLTMVLDRLLPEPQAGLLAGILFGTKAALGRHLTDVFIATGTIHIIALSGQNVSIIVTLLTTTLLGFVSRRIASLLILLVLGLFLWFVGPSASLVRAVIMGYLTLFAVISGRQSRSLLSLTLAVSTMLVLYPLWITDPGFQLSVLATLGIILFGGTPKIDDRRPNIEKPNLPSVFHLQRPVSILHPLSSYCWSIIKDDLRITLAAQLFTTPLIFFHFHRVSLVAPLTNVLIGWTMPFIMGFGWAAALAGYVWLPLGIIPAWSAWVLLTYVIRVVEITSRLPVASIAW